MGSENLINDAKEFFESNKKEIGKVAREGKRTVYLSFQDISSYSHDLALALLNEPLDTIRILETSLEESGLLNNPKVLIEGWPIEPVIIGELSSKHLGKFIAIEGKVIIREKVKIRVGNVKFECPNCGSNISVLQKEKNFKEPSRCSCGRKGGFTLKSRDASDHVGFTLMDEKKNTLELNVGLDLIDYNLDILGEGNTVKVLGILQGDYEDVSEVHLKMEPISITLVQKAESGDVDVDSYIEALRSQGNKGAWAFEEFIGKLFEKKGYKVTVTKKTGDFGIDVTAVNGKENIAIQCKLNDRNVKISNSPIQKALGSLTSPYNATKLIFVTTADEYTPQAVQQVGKTKLAVELWNRKKLIAEVQAHMHDLEEGWDILNSLDETEEDVLQVSPDTYDLDISKISTGNTAVAKNKINLVKESLERLQMIFKKAVPIEEIEKDLKGNMSALEVEEIIEELCLLGHIFKPRRGFVQVM